MRTGVRGFGPRGGSLVAHLGERFGNRVETASNQWEERRARRSQGQRPGTAAEQGAAGNGLQQADLMADRGWRQTEFVRCRLEAQVPCCRLEGAERLQRWEPSHRRIIAELNSAR